MVEKYNDPTILPLNAFNFLVLTRYYTTYRNFRDLRLPNGS